jgi:hypothetical protein
MTYIRLTEDMRSTHRGEGMTPSESQNSFDSWGSDSRLNEGVIRVFAAYETGVSPDTSIKLQLTEQTAAKEVVKSVMTQFNSMVRMKGMTGPVYDGNQIDNNFQLVLVSDSHEIILEDEYRVLDLMTNYKMAKFHVRRKNSC